MQNTAIHVEIPIETTVNPPGRAAFSDQMFIFNPLHAGSMVPGQIDEGDHVIDAAQTPQRPRPMGHPRDHSLTIRPRTAESDTPSGREVENCPGPKSFLSIVIPAKNEANQSAAASARNHPVAPRPPRVITKQGRDERGSRSSSWMMGRPMKHPRCLPSLAALIPSFVS